MGGVWYGPSMAEARKESDPKIACRMRDRRICLGGHKFENVATRLNTGCKHTWASS
jgi:hypothetical protein